MINTISNFNLMLFDTLPNAGQGTPAPVVEKGDFASILLGIPVTSVPVNSADPAAVNVPANVNAQTPVPLFEAPAESEEEKLTELFLTPVQPETAAAADLPIPQEDLCWGVMGCETPAKDSGLEVIKARRFIVDFEAPVKLPPQDAPGQPGGKDTALSVLTSRRVIANVEPAIKLPPRDGIDVSTADKKYPVEALHRQRPVTGPVLPITTGAMPATDIVENWGSGEYDAQKAAVYASTPADPARQSDAAAETVRQPDPMIPGLPAGSEQRESLWSNESPRIPKPNKDFGFAVLKVRRQITDQPAQVPDQAPVKSTGMSISAKALSGVSQDVVVTDPRVSPDTNNGKTALPAQTVAETGTAATPAATGTRVNKETDTRDASEPKQKAELNPIIRPGALPLKSGKPLGSETIETPETPETLERIKTPVAASNGVTENLSVLGHLRREVSIAYQPVPEGGPRTLQSYTTVRNAVPRIDDQAFLEAADRQTEHETVRGETVQSRDSVDIFSSVLDKFRNTDAPAVNDVKNETVAELLKQAKETIEQLKPGLIELASLAARRNEKQTMRMRLHPAELGTVDISLERNSAGGLNAHFNTANDSAREVLTHNLDQLRESLQNAGWQVGQLQVSSGSSPFTSANDQRDRQPQSETFRGHMPGNSAEQSDETEQDTSRLLNLRA